MPVLPVPLPDSPLPSPAPLVSVDPTVQAQVCGNGVGVLGQRDRRELLGTQSATVRRRGWHGLIDVSPTVQADVCGTGVGVLGTGSDRRLRRDARARSAAAPAACSGSTRTSSSACAATASASSARARRPIAPSSSSSGRVGRRRHRWQAATVAGTNGGSGSGSTAELGARGARSGCAATPGALAQGDPALHRRQHRSLTALAGLGWPAPVVSVAAAPSRVQGLSARIDQVSAHDHPGHAGAPDLKRPVEAADPRGVASRRRPGVGDAVVFGERSRRRARARAVGVPLAVRQYAGRVLGYLRAQGAPEPEDLTSEVFLRAFDRLAQFSGDEPHFRSWLFTIVHRILIDDARRRQRRPRTTALGLRSRRSPPVTSSTKRWPTSVAEWADALLASLPPDQRAVVALRVDGRPLAGAGGQILDKRVGAVKSLQHRALAASAATMRGGAGMNDSTSSSGSPSPTRTFPRRPRARSSSAAHGRRMDR